MIYLTELGFLEGYIDMHQFQMKYRVKYIN